MESRAGWIAATSSELDALHPEKVLMMRSDFAAKRNKENLALIAALLEACKFCDQPENHAEMAAILARPEFIGVSKTVLRRGISGEMDFGHGVGKVMRDFCIFHRDGANEPSGDKAAWVFDLIRSSGLCKDATSINFTFAKKIFRSDIFDQVVRLRSVSPTFNETKPQLAIA